MTAIEDEREALVNALLRSRFFESHDWAGTGSWPGEEYIRWELGQLADDILSGFRRQGPITDAQVEAGLSQFYAHVWSGRWTANEEKRMRAALEAARDAS